jgi:hypothetical protein
MTSPTDSDRLDWLERNLIHLTHARAASSAQMDGTKVKGQLLNEARGTGAGPSYFRVDHRTIREALDDAMEQTAKSERRKAMDDLHDALGNLVDGE